METSESEDTDVPSNVSRQRHRDGLSTYLSLTTLLRIYTIYLLLVRYPYAILSLISDILNVKFRPNFPSEIHQNQTWAEVVQSGTQSDVVRPLFSRKQPFDVEVTVWRRRTQEEWNAAWEQWVIDTRDLRWEEYDGQYVEDALFEKPIFSDTVFRGLKLKDGVDVFTSIPLQIPLEIFMGGHVSTSDIRASIVLIPSTPSILDRVSDFSTWYGPPWTKRPRMRPPQTFPFRDGHRYNYTQPLVRSMRDYVLETFALSTDLIRFQEREKPDMTDAPNRSDEQGNCVGMFENGTIYRAEASHMILPYIMTRTHIRMSKHASLLNHKHLDSGHQLLKSFRRKLCREPRGRNLNNKPSWTSCRRQYHINGHWETLVKLHPLANSEMGHGVEWAYTPYLDTLAGVAFPDERIPAPITRGSCGRENGESVIANQGVMNFTWHLSLTANSLSEISFGERMGPHMEKRNRNPTINDREAQMTVFMNAMAGHHRENAHPLRKFMLNLAGYSMNVVVLILKFRYWGKPREHVNIHGILFLTSYHIYEGVQSSDPLLHVKLRRLTDLHMAVGTEILLTRYTLILGKFGSRGIRRWIPALERNSTIRGKGTITLPMTIMLFVTTLGLSLTALQGHFLVQPGPRVKTRSLLPAVPFSAWVIGKLCQLDLNRQTGMFAGDYKVTVLAEAFREIIKLILLLERVVGTDEWRQGMNVMDGLRLVVLAVTAWQAIWLPQYERKEEREVVLDATSTEYEGIQ